ncbi:MAG: M23 family metallopeptidase [Proteobacteria bacterium]|nr:M23 family metallopeptidase [Pseudomonadota bacterium]
MNKIKLFLRKSFTCITIMVIPHSKFRPLKIRVSAIGLLSCFILCFIGAGYLISIGINTIEYYGMKQKYLNISSQFSELKTVMFSLKKANEEFSKLLSFKSKKVILEKADFTNTGALDIELLKKQVDETIQSVSEVKKYIEEQKNIYQTTPKGWPIKGTVNSAFGLREHPISGIEIFHSGMDIGASIGTQIKATADGIVSFSSWHNDSGYIVVLEHGNGFTTVYAHNSKNYVKIGQKIKRGEAIGISGSTGATTGPHLHYEVWKNGKPVNPASFLKDMT